MSQIQMTEAELLERQRMKDLASDADVVAALNRFDNWQRKQALHKNYGNNAVPQMLLFLRQTLEAGRPLRDALLERLDRGLDRMKDEAQDLDPRLQYATDYVVDAFRTDRDLVNYDPKFYYMMKFISFSKFNFKRDQRGHVVAEFNTIFGAAYGDKKVFIHALAHPRLDSSGNVVPIPEKQAQEGTSLIETDVLRGYFNISFHNNNIGGRATWEEGEEIALGIYDFIQHPRSRGLLCSLLPPTGPISIDWSRNPWIHDQHLHGWIDTQQPQDMLLYFDQMAALPDMFTEVKF